MARALALLVIVSARVATASPSDDSRQAALIEPAIEVEAVRPQDLAWNWRIDALLAGRHAGDAITGDVAATGETTVSYQGIDWVVVGGLVDVHDTATVSAEQWATLCLACDHDTRVDVQHRLSWELEPGILASARRRPYPERRESVRFEALEDPQPAEAGASASAIGGAWLEVSTAWRPEAETLVDLGGVAMRYRKADVTIDAAAFSVAAFVDGAALLRADVVHVQGLALGDGRRLDAAAGIAGYFERVVIPVGSATLEQDVGDATAHVTAAQDAFPMPTGEYAVEDRVALGVAMPGRVRLRGDAFAALTTLVTPGAMHTRVRSGGLTGIAELDLGSHATARLRADAGRGFHADDWGVELLATLDLHASSD